jgi:hypothetical protein
MDTSRGGAAEGAGWDIGAGEKYTNIWLLPIGYWLLRFGYWAIDWAIGYRSGYRAVGVSNSQTAQ